MPLASGYGRDTIARNIEMLEREGKPRKQAAAIALAHARVDYFRRFPQGFLPKWLLQPKTHGLKHHYDKHGKPLHGPQENPASILKGDITDVQQGDIVRFAAYALQVYDAPKRYGNFIVLRGRISTGGNPIVTKKFLPPLAVKIERESAVNPSPAIARSAIDAARRLGKAFSGHDFNRAVRMVRNPPSGPRLAIGPVSGIMYLAKRDGVTKEYLHRFAPRSRPLLVTTSDGTTLELLGGAFRFTDRGIVDTKPRRRGR